MNKEIIIDGVVYVKKEDNKAKKTKKINITIKNRFTGAIIYESEKTTYKDAINEMVKDANNNGTRADLTRANLADADLTRINLTGANLTDADLTSANLADANLTDVNLTGANLTDADLTNANLTDADLTSANLADANLTDVNLSACIYYMGSANKNFEALCKAIKTIKWNSNTGSDFIK